MMASKPCPDPDRLKELLQAASLAQVPAGLVTHVDTCESCQQTLEEITLASMLWPGALPTLPPLPEPALQKAMEQLATAAPTIDHSSPPAEEPALDFLKPSDNPEHLGKLGHYEILEILGRGGMGVVLKAFDPPLNRIVAIKVLVPHMAVSPVARQRFIREAQSAAAINHDHVVTIHAVEEANGVLFLVMHYVAGPSLQQWLEAAAGPLPLGEIVHIGRQTAAGLAAAHAKGLIHRDIKPANILLGEASGGVRGDAAVMREENTTHHSPSTTHQVKISDFGLARAINDVSLSQAGIVSGTPLYMSPEQISGGAIDHRSDLYSLGVLLYRMATGREPFVGEDTTQVWSKHLFERPPAPSEVAPAPLPGWLEHLILRLLQKDPAARPQSAEEVIRALDPQPAPVPVPGNEEARLAALHRYRILDTDPEQAFDDLAFLAAHVCGTPIALITLVDADRQWFKSKVGLSLQETARNISFCTHTIMNKDPLFVGDALADERFAGSPLVCGAPNVRFYAGFPLVTPEGHALGALCVMDQVPRQLSPDQVSALAALSRLVLLHLELRRDLLNFKDGVTRDRG